MSAQGFDVKNCEARIIGGQTNFSMDTVKEIQKALEEKQYNIVEMDVFGYGVRAIQLDLNTGEVTDYKETIHQRDDIDMVAMRTIMSNKLTEYKPPQMGL